MKMLSFVNDFLIFFIGVFILLIGNIGIIYGIINLYYYLGLVFVLSVLFIPTFISLIAGTKHLILNIKNTDIKPIESIKKYFLSGSVTNDFIYLYFFIYILFSIGFGSLGVMIIIFITLFYAASKFKFFILKKVPNIGTAP